MTRLWIWEGYTLLEIALIMSHCVNMLLKMLNMIEYADIYLKKTEC